MRRLLLATAVVSVLAGEGCERKPRPVAASTGKSSGTTADGSVTTAPQAQAVSSAPTAVPSDMLNPAVTQTTIGATICVAGYTRTTRPPTSVTNRIKIRQIAAYGYQDVTPGSFEEDLWLDSTPACLHTASMPNVLVRDLPDDVHAELQRRALQHGQSLQQYLTDELTRLTARPPLAEVLARISSRRGGRVGLDQAVGDIAAERDQR